jgi:predicted alpha/beta hydrolase family esterase
MEGAMTRQVLFIQGAGEGAFDDDAKLAADLREKLGSGYQVRYPQMPNEDDPSSAAWKQLILAEIEAMGDGAILVGHSVGASVIIKVVCDGKLPRRLAGIFLVAAPFWHDHEFWRSQEDELPKDASARLPKDVPLFLYHGRNDEVVPFAHVEMYAAALPQAKVRRLDRRNHQLNDDLAEVAGDIQRLAT